MGCPLEASWRTVQNVGITRNRKGNAGGGFRRLPGVRRGQWRRTYAWEGVWNRRKKDVVVYEKNSRRPCAPHGQKEFCTENKKEHIRKK